MTNPAPRSASADSELALETTFGGPGIEVEGEIRVIDLTDFDLRRDQIDDAIWSAAADVGFFQVTGHGIAQADVDEAFRLAAEFFDLPPETKALRQMPQGTNSGWEYRTQRRPSTGTLDEKESYQVTISRMDHLDLWPTEEELAGFRSTLEAFEEANHRLAMRVLSCFARKLGFAESFFDVRHDRTSPQYQSTLRLLHYLPVTAEQLDPRLWRAGAHTDYDCLTLLHQRPGQHGLQLSPGSQAANRLTSTSQTHPTSQADPRGQTDPGDQADQTAPAPLEWTSVEPTEGTVTCNIGDMLMRWSDDRLPSTLHRVRMPRADEYLGPRYSIAYFAQADRDAIIEGPARLYEPITAADYLQQRIAANFREH